MGKSHDLATLKDDGGTLKGSLFVGKDQSGYTSLVKNFSTSHDAANRSKHLRVGIQDGSFTGMLVENIAADSGTYNSQEIKFDTHEGGVSVATRMKIDSRGRVTMPYQPSYMAYDGQSVVSSSTVVKYSNVAFNVGNHYNSTNGRFTAPVTGTYVVGCYIQAHTTTHQTYTSITFQKNGSQYGTSELVQTWAGGSDHTVTGGVILMQLNAGDYSQVTAGRGYRGIQGYSFAYLTG